jgi:hypothetical protein
MCLHRIEKEHVPPMAEMVGYKFFLPEDGQVLGPYYGGFYDLNTLYPSVKMRVKTSHDNRNYDSGFHFYQDFAEAKSTSYIRGYSLYRCRFRQIRIEGFEGDVKVFVADEMTVLEKIK